MHCFVERDVEHTKSQEPSRLAFLLKTCMVSGKSFYLLYTSAIKRESKSPSHGVDPLNKIIYLTYFIMYPRVIQVELKFLICAPSHNKKNFK